MGKLLRGEMVSEWRENAITRGGAEKYYFVICFSVDTSTPELASMESTCFASVTGVAFAECKRTSPLPPSLLLRFYTTSWKSCTSSVVGKTVCVVVRRIYLVSQTTRIVAMPLCCLLRSPRDAPINVTEDYVSFCRSGKRKGERGGGRERCWNELRGEIGLFITIEFRYWRPTYCILRLTFVEQIKP